jgi:hypothetical protein
MGTTVSRWPVNDEGPAADWPVPDRKNGATSATTIAASGIANNHSHLRRFD